MLSKKTKYAFMALIRLTQEYGKGAILSNEIAKTENLPQRFLENILLELKNIGILGSKLGKSGGYYLLRKPEEIRMSEIVRHFEGTIALLPCVSEKAYQACDICKSEPDCKIRAVYKDIRDYSFAVLDRTTIADLAPKKPKDIEYYI